MYILTFKARRKNAKRHIWGYYKTLEEVRKNATHPRYDFTVYNYKWEFIEDIKEGE